MKKLCTVLFLFIRIFSPDRKIDFLKHTIDGYSILITTKSAKFFSSLFFNVYNENMFTIEIEDGREAS